MIHLDEKEYKELGPIIGDILMLQRSVRKDEKERK